MSVYTSLITKVSNSTQNVSQYLGQYLSTMFNAPTKKQTQFMLFCLGITLVASGITVELLAQGDVGSDLVGEYNDERVGEAVNRIFAYIEGSFGALIMVAAGLGAIMAAALGSYSAAIGLLVVAVGAFVLRSLVGTFFNTESIQ